MSGRAMIVGGATDEARQAGGEALFRQVQVLLAGNRADAALYALTNSLGVAMCNLCDSEDEAGSMAGVVLGDVLNFVALNYDDIHRQVVTMRQQQATNPGQGAVQ